MECHGPRGRMLLIYLSLNSQEETSFHMNEYLCKSKETKEWNHIFHSNAPNNNYNSN